MNYFDKYIVRCWLIHLRIVVNNNAIIAVNNTPFTILNGKMPATIIVYNESQTTGAIPKK